MTFDSELCESLVQFVGRLHPMVVHFPIALIITAGFIELVRLRKPKTLGIDPAFYCLLLGSLGAIAAAVTGWINAEDYGTENLELFLHRWLGVGIAAFGIVACVFSLLARSDARHWAKVTYRVLLVATISMVAVGGHYGAGLVHGDDYLWSVFESKREKAKAETRSHSLEE